MDKETGYFTPAQAAVHDLHRAMPVTLSTPATAITRPRQHHNHNGNIMNKNTPGGAGGPRQAVLRLRAEHCQGHARCSEFLPELLIQDGYGPVQLKGDGAIPSPLLERARLAVACCPEMAIELLHE